MAGPKLDMGVAEVSTYSQIFGINTHGEIIFNFFILKIIWYKLRLFTQLIQVRLAR